MKPDRYELSPPGRRRLSGMLQQRGSRLGLSSWGGFAFGGLFVAVGTAISLVGMKVLPVNPATVHAPYWVLSAAGGSFALGGLMVWGMTGKQFSANRRRLNAARQHPHKPALADYPWHPDGFAVSGWRNAVKATAMAAGVTVFLSMFNWWAFVASREWLLKAMVILFDGLGLLAWWQAARQWARSRKFGDSKITFTRFPYPLTAPVVLRWQPPRGVSRVNKGTFTLRCVEQWIERRGRGDNGSASLVQEEIWSATWILDQPRNLPLKEAVELSFDLSLEALPTDLSAEKPRFWELEVKLDLPGLDFSEKYLVPIYS